MSIRITGGSLRGRQLQVPAGPARPTQDRVRAALFSMLGDFTAGARVLDLYAGSGALGLEALSRGATQVIWVERHKKSWLGLCDNIRTLTGKEPGKRLVDINEPGELTCVCDDVFRFLRRLSAETHNRNPFDLIFADPPYDDAKIIVKKLLPALRQGGILHSNTQVVLEQASDVRPAQLPGWELVRARNYGDSCICLYRPLTEGEDEGKQSGNISGDF